MTKQEKYEKWVVRQYLRFKSQRYRQLKCLSEFRPDHAKAGIAGPDVKLKLWDTDPPRHIGIELTDYQVDQSKHGSAARILQDRWKHIYRIIRSNHVWRYSEFLNAYLHVSFDKRCLPRRKDARFIARELVRFALSKLKIRGKTKIYDRMKGYKKPGDYDSFPHLKKHFESIRVVRIKLDPYAIPLRWSYADAACVNVIPSVITRKVAEKARKMSRYDLSDLDECWLLICATGQTSSDRAGPQMASQHFSLSAEVKEAARRSRFDRVIFWERFGGWDDEIVKR